MHTRTHTHTIRDSHPARFEKLEKKRKKTKSKKFVCVCWSVVERHLISRKKLQNLACQSRDNNCRIVCSFLDLGVETCSLRKGFGVDRSFRNSGTVGAALGEHKRRGTFVVVVVVVVVVVPARKTRTQVLPYGTCSEKHTHLRVFDSFSLLK